MIRCGFVDARHRIRGEDLLPSRRKFSETFYNTQDVSHGYESHFIKESFGSSYVLVFFLRFLFPYRILGKGAHVIEDSIKPYIEPSRFSGLIIATGENRINACTML